MELTANQSALIVHNPNTKKAIAVLKKYANVVAAYKKVEEEIEDATDLLAEAMIEQNIPRIEIDMPELTGYITLAERTNYKADDLEQVDDEYLKPTLDTEKVKAQAVLTGALPEGVVESKTQYITKKFKVVK